VGGDVVPIFAPTTTKKTQIFHSFLFDFFRARPSRQQSTAAETQLYLPRNLFLLHHTTPPIRCKQQKQQEQGVEQK
jgi:hypothetical protein